MAINPSNDVPNTDAPNAAYPYGSGRNVSTPTATDGTPYQANLLNDIWGFLQSVLTDAGNAPNGNPDSVTNQQYLGSMKDIIVDVVNPLIPVIPPITPDTIFLTVAEMVADADDVLAPGLSAMTLGYNSPGDGGAGLYVIVANGTGTADGGLFINLPNSTGNPQAELLNNGFVYPEQYGANGNNTGDDGIEILAALQAVGNVVLNANKVYRITGIDAGALNGVRVGGFGRLNLTNGSNTDALILGEDCTVENITIDGNGSNQTTGALIVAKHDLHVVGARLLNGSDQAVRVQESGPTKGTVITNCTITNTTHGVKLSNIEGASITNCQFRSIAQAYFQVEATSLSAVEIDGVIVTGCAFSSASVDIFDIVEVGLATVGTNIKAQACVFDGGLDDSFDILDAKNNVRAIVGSGSPEGVEQAGVGSTYRRRDGGLGSTLYVKESGAGNVGWAAVNADAGSIQSTFFVYTDTTASDTLDITNAIEWRALLVAPGGGGGGGGSAQLGFAGGGAGGSSGAVYLTPWIRKTADNNITIQEIGEGGAGGAVASTGANGERDSTVVYDGVQYTAPRGLGGGGGATANNTSTSGGQRRTRAANNGPGFGSEGWGGNGSAGNVGGSGLGGNASTSYAEYTNRARGASVGNGGQGGGIGGTRGGNGGGGGICPIPAYWLDSVGVVLPGISLPDLGEAGNGGRGGINTDNPGRPGTVATGFGHGGGGGGGAGDPNNSGDPGAAGTDGAQGLIIIEVRSLVP